MEERIKFHVGLDVHKDSMSVAAAELGRSPRERRSHAVPARQGARGR